MAETVTDSTFWRLVFADDTFPALVFFYASSSGPSLAIAPSIDQLAGLFAGSADIFKMDIDENPQTAEIERVRDVPVVKIYKGGSAVQTIEGVMTESTLIEALKAFV